MFLAPKNPHAPIFFPPALLDRPLPTGVHCYCRHAELTRAPHRERASQGGLLRSRDGRLPPSGLPDVAARRERSAACVNCVRVVSGSNVPRTWMRRVRASRASRSYLPRCPDAPLGIPLWATCLRPPPLPGIVQSPILEIP